MFFLINNVYIIKGIVSLNYKLSYVFFFKNLIEK